MFRVAPSLDLKKLEAIFRHKVFKMLLAKGRITRVKIRNTGREEPVCPDEPQKCLTVLAKSLKTRPPHLYPENPPNPR